MEKELGQEEIDALFQAARTRTVASPTHPRVLPWSFSRSGQISNEQLRAITMLNDIFARNLTHHLSAWLRSRVQVSPWKEQPGATEVGKELSPVTKLAGSNPLVRPGSRVTVFSHDRGTEIHLMGVALDRGSSGATVRVRAGLHGAILHGIVRGPAEVELISSKGRP